MTVEVSFLGGGHGHVGLGGGLSPVGAQGV